MSRPHIAINDQPVILPIDEGTSVATAIAMVCDGHMICDHVLSEIVIDGLAWRTDEDALLDSLPLDAIASLTLYSQPVNAAADLGAADISDASAVIQSRLGLSSRAFRLGQMDKALMHFIKAAELLKDSLHLIRLLLDRASASSDDPQRVRLKTFDGALSTALDAFNEAQIAEDWALVADLIEYEIGPRALSIAHILDPAPEALSH